MISLPDLVGVVEHALARPLPSLHPFRTTLAELDVDSLDLIALTTTAGALVPGIVFPTERGLVDPSWTVSEVHHLLCAWEERSAARSESRCIRSSPTVNEKGWP